MKKNFNIVKTGLKNLVSLIKKQETSSLGNLNTSIFYYITPLMIITVSFFLFTILTNLEDLKPKFETNVPLNSSIIGFLAVAMIMATFNNVKLFFTAQFLNTLDRVANQDVITDADILKLKSMLESKGSLVNISNMSKVVESIADYGGLNFSDNDARLIKSKFGYRISGARGRVSFFGGILVMLGLLGTFLGLLSTIDAVGGVLGALTNMDMSADASAVMIDFIGSMSAPLQGMGLAFSSSLFGLSGSLLIGLFVHLSAGAQNSTIEDVSRWIDDRIPRLDGKTLKKGAHAKVPGSDDLKSWMAGYVMMSNKMNSRMRELFSVLSESARASSEMMRNTELMCTQYDRMAEAIREMNIDITAMRDTNQNLANHLSRLQPSLENVNNTMETAAKTLSANISVFQDLVDKKALGGASTTEGGASLPVHELQSVLKQLHMSQQQLAHELSDLKGDKDSSGSLENTGGMSPHLTSQLKVILDEINNSGEDRLGSVLNKKDNK